MIAISNLFEQKMTETDRKSTQIELLSDLNDAIHSYYMRANKHVKNGRKTVKKTMSLEKLSRAMD